MSDRHRISDRYPSEGKALMGGRRPAGTNPVPEIGPEEDALALLDTFIDGLANRFAGLDSDLRESGFGAYSLGLAKELYDHFGIAIEATRKTSSATYPWEELRSLAARLESEGFPDGAAEISEGLVKRAARHTLPSDLLDRLTADSRRRASRARLTGASAEAPILVAEKREQPRRKHRLGLAALALGATVAVAVAGNIAVLNFIGTADAPPPASAQVASSAPVAAGAATSSPAPAESKFAAAGTESENLARAAVAAKTSQTATGEKFFALADPQRGSGGNDVGTITAPTPASPVAGTTGTVAPAKPPKPDTTVTANASAIVPPPAPASRAPMANAADLLDPNQATAVQRRLSELGYFAGPADGIWGPRSRVALRSFKGANGLSGDDSFDAQTRQVLFSARAVGTATPVTGDAPVVVAGGDTVYAPIPGTELNPLNPRDAAIIQARLAELGYYQAAGEGTWGPASRQALRDFKALSGMDANDVWDGPTEQRLRSAAAAPAGGTIIGAWARGKQACALPESPGRDVLWITSSTIRSDYRTCRIGAISRQGRDWVAVAYCGGPPQAMRFAVNGNFLLERGNGGTVYRRCTPPRPGIVATSAPAAPVLNVDDAYYGPPPSLYGPPSSPANDYVAGTAGPTPPGDVGVSGGAGNNTGSGDGLVGSVVGGAVDVVGGAISGAADVVGGVLHR